ncbi:DUF2975 domain-containing protein [uncultured Odoribacter sp.]|uniref:DUF2975 domain-containing protein n=1 Tax=uncultured Odoribacter sp. TaxID=876416 RepID=UPI00261B54D5|nr:DUF2975 domain-containing protein [uncultured Odoribacter sp.]
MTSKRKIIFRLNILYAIFLGLIITFLVTNINSNDFKKGTEDKNSLLNTYYNIPVVPLPSEYDIPIQYNADSTLKITAQITAANIKINKSEISSQKIQVWSIILQLFSGTCYIAICTILFVVLFSLRNSLRHDNLFNRDNIKLIRAIGILLIASSLLCNLAYYLEAQSLSDLLKGTSLLTSVDIYEFGDLFAGILILVIAEIFAIGYDLSEEQKLTI